MGSFTWKSKEELDTEVLQNARNIKILELKNACSQAIFNGFSSESTGYEFGFNELDQSNFTQQTLLIIAAGGPEYYTEKIYWKTKSGQVVELSPVQFLTIVEESKIHKLNQQNKYWQLESQVKNAQSLEEIRAINW